jgi:hypothetical protein
VNGDDLLDLSNAAQMRSTDGRWRACRHLDRLQRGRIAAIAIMPPPKVVPKSFSD